MPLHIWSLGSQTRCADLLLILSKPSARKWAYTDSSTLTYTIVSLGTQRGGGILPCKVTNLVNIMPAHTYFTYMLQCLFHHSIFYSLSFTLDRSLCVDWNFTVFNLCSVCLSVVSLWWNPNKLLLSAYFWQMLASAATVVKTMSTSMTTSTWMKSLQNQMNC